MKWSIIGGGYISNIFCENLIKQKTSKIISISSKDKNKLKNFGAKFNIHKNRRFNNYENILDLDSDVTYIGVVNSYHKTLVKKLAENKKNILVEKPCFLNTKDFDETVKIIKSKKVLFVESMMNLHHPQTFEIFKLIQSGEIGDIIRFNHNFGFDIRKKFLKFFKKKINFYNRLTDPKLGGGAINDLGCYGVSFANKLANLKNTHEIVEIKKNNIIGQTGVDENSSINITFNNGFNVNLEVSLISGMGCKATIEGTKGKLIIPNLVNPQKKFKIIIQKKISKEFNFKAENLYSYIINDVERYIKNDFKEADNYGLRLSEIRKNLLLLDTWKSQK